MTSADLSESPTRVKQPRGANYDLVRFNSLDVQ